MRLKHTSQFGKLSDRLNRLQRELPRRGAQWAGESARTMDKNCRDHLENQGRGGQPPPLSPMTRRIYQASREPDGSGIVNHLTLDYQKQGNNYTAILGIPEGKPTIVAKVQDRGKTIEVTERMRGFLAAAYGIFLKESTTHIVIPPRRFWELSLKKTNAAALKELKQILDSI